jgi:hypothetical protein
LRRSAIWLAVNFIAIQKYEKIIETL